MRTNIEIEIRNVKLYPLKGNNSNDVTKIPVRLPNVESA